MECVILAAGEGKRMRPLTASRPKVMLPVAGKPILEHLLERAVSAGFKDFLFVTQYQAPVVRSYFRNGQKWNARIRYLDQGAPGGTGHAVARLARWARQPFALLYGDSLFAAKDLAQFHDGTGLAIGAKRVPDSSPYGLLTLRNGRLAAIEEKPPTPQAGWVNVGAYRLSKSLVQRCVRLTSSPRGEMELTDAFSEALRDEPVRVVKCTSWEDVGRPWDLLGAQERLMVGLERRIQGDVDRSAVLEGPVVVEKGARIRHGTVIEGPAIVQRGARVGPHAFIRPSTAIGPDCHVGAHVEVKNSILMERTNVPHLSYVGDSILGSGVNLGAGTNVANLKHSAHTVRVRLEDGRWIDTGRRKFGVVLGDDVKTGINATLNVGAVLCQGVRVGAGRLVEGWVPAGATLN